MNNSKFFLLFLFALFLFSFSFLDSNAQDVTGSWSGTISLHETMTYDLGNNDRQITIFFTDNKGTGTVVENGEFIVGGKLFCTSSCRGSGTAELHEVTVNMVDSIYRIHAISPPYTCTNTGTNCDKPTTDWGELDIIVYERPLNSGPNVLAGSETKVNKLAANGKSTTTITWNLVRQIDVELIVTPQNYDNWLPVPGIDEATHGPVMNVMLKLQGKNGRPLLQKAKAFELRLSNTSREPGITINFPLNPSDPQPDLRFMMQAGADTSEEGQFISIPCQSPCLTSSAKIAAFDGGGWTTLTAFAILEDGTPIKGSLLISGGDQEIRIPKRDVGSQIATAWLQANGNPGDMDDDETSPIQKSAGNTNDGDGLTAYEEYRGVISEGSFQRLDPKKKEVGILASQLDFSLFTEGISWFKNASDLKPVRFDFDKDEIGPDGKLNMNVKTSHDFDQYAIYLLNGGLGRDGTLGITYSRMRPTIPANVISVVVDWDYIKTSYQGQVSRIRPETLKFTLREYLAQTVAHELGHAVNIRHHGSDNPKKMSINPDDRIIYRNGNLMTPHPDTLRNIGDSAGTVEGGDLSCMLNYYPYFSWGNTIGANGVNIFNQEPLLPLGRKFCKSPDATGVNATKFYFGKAAKGNCLGQIQLKN